MAYKRKVKDNWYWYTSERKRGKPTSIYLGPVKGTKKPPKKGKGSILPSLEALIEINKEVAEQEGFTPGIISQGNLEYVLDTLKDIHGVYNQAAQLFLKLIKGHPFVDGNKRTAYATMKAFLGRNGKQFTVKDYAAVVNVILKIDAGEMDRKDVRVWITNHCR